MLQKTHQCLSRNENIIQHWTTARGASIRERKNQHRHDAVFYAIEERTAAPISLFPAHLFFRRPCLPLSYSIFSSMTSALPAIMV